MSHFIGYGVSKFLRSFYDHIWALSNMPFYGVFSVYF